MNSNYFKFTSWLFTFVFILLCKLYWWSNEGKIGRFLYYLALLLLDCHNQTFRWNSDATSKDILFWVSFSSCQCKTWLVHSNFSWFSGPTIHLHYQDFSFHSENFLTSLEQPKWFPLQSTTKMVLQQTENHFFDWQQNRQSLKLLSSVCSKPSSYFKVYIFFKLYLAALSRE